MIPDKLQQTMELFGEIERERGETGMINEEARRITNNIDLFEAIIREVYKNVTMVVGGHHIMFMQEGEALPGEISSADTLIFDVNAATILWGSDYKKVLSQLACEPQQTREALLRQLYNGR